MSKHLERLSGGELHIRLNEVDAAGQLVDVALLGNAATRELALETLANTVCREQEWARQQLGIEYPDRIPAVPEMPGTLSVSAPLGRTVTFDVAGDQQYA